MNCCHLDLAKSRTSKRALPKQNYHHPIVGPPKQSQRLKEPLQGLEYQNHRSQVQLDTIELLPDVFDDIAEGLLKLTISIFSPLRCAATKYDAARLSKGF